MKKIFLLLAIAFLLPVLTSAQDLFIPDNPYDKADDYTKSRKAFNRERHFYEQRMFPFNFIPSDAYTKAIEQRDALRSKNGFYFDNSVNWFSIGPTPGSYPSYGAISSRITSIKVDKTNPNIIYIGAAFGGIWKTLDGGLTWSPKTDFENSLSTGAIAIDHTNPNIIYYGTGEATYSGTSYYGRGLLKSTNGGDTWTNYTTGLPNLTYFARISISPANSNLLIAALGNSGIYRSTDAGVSWTNIASGKFDDITFSTTGDTCYAMGNVGFMISYNAGVSFTGVGAGITPGTRNHLAMSKSNPNIFYVSTYSGSTITVYKSTNKGVNFSNVSGSYNFSGSQAWYDFYIHVSPFDPDWVYVGSIDIHRSSNGGTNWANITNGYGGGTTHVDQHNMEFHPTDVNIVYAVNDGGVYKSTNRGTNFVNMNTNLNITQFYRIASNPSDPAQILGGTQDNGTQQTRGTLYWTGVYGGDGGEVCFQSQNNNVILGETQNNGVFRSTNGGYNFSSATSGLTGSGSWVAPLLSHPDSIGIMYTARGQVFKTINNASSWTAISTGTSGTIREMAISKSKPSVMYASSGSSIFKSINRGYTFTNVTTGLPGKTITSININPIDDNDVLITHSGFGGAKVYRTTNGGLNWVSIFGDLPDSPVNDGMFYYPGFSTNIILAATDIGVFMTTNNGTNWTEIAGGLPNTVAIHLDMNVASGKLRIGTHGRGVWELSGSLVGITNFNSEVPANYSLTQNYPNPFNPSTNIKFSIPKGGFTTLKIYNNIGQLVNTLVAKELSPGTYEATFSADNLSSGVYFYNLTSGKFSETKSMILIK